MENIQTKLDVLTHKDILQKVRIIHPYLPEWDLVPFPTFYRAPKINQYYGKGSPSQHFHHFHSLIGNIMGNDALMIRSLIGSLKGIALD